MLCVAALANSPVFGDERKRAAADAVVLTPDNDIQAAVETHPLGTTFLLSPGVYTGQSVRPHDGQTIDGGGQAILDGENRVKTAFSGDGRDVTLRGMTIQNYRPDEQKAAVDSEAGRGWRIEGNTIRGSYHIGVNAGTDTRVIGNKLVENGMSGFDGGGRGWLFENNEIADNNTRKLDWGFEGGGGKVTVSTSGTFRGNKVHGNYGPGIWLDGNANNIVIEENEVWNNAGPGIMVEISHSAAVRNNTLWNNGEKKEWIYAQIVISSAERNKVYGNRIEVAPGHNGVFVMSQGREYQAVDNEIYGNKVWLFGTDPNTTGIDVDDNSDALTSNKFHLNEYHLADFATPYFSLGADDLTLREMQSRGQELGSTASPIDAAKANVGPKIGSFTN